MRFSGSNAMLINDPSPKRISESIGDRNDIAFKRHTRSSNVHTHSFRLGKLRDATFSLHREIPHDISDIPPPPRSDSVSGKPGRSDARISAGFQRERYRTDYIMSLTTTRQTQLSFIDADEAVFFFAIQ